MKLVPRHNFDKQNKLTAKRLCDDIVSADYGIISVDYNIIIHWLEHVVYNFLIFVVQTLKNVSLNKNKWKP